MDPEMADESPEMFGKQAIAALLDFDWSRLGDWHEARDDGIWVVPPAADDPHLETPAELEVRIAHPTSDLDSPALPFPFTAEQFFAFCESTPLFSFDYIEAVYSNDDHSLDLPALAALARKNKPSAKLVRGLLERKYGLPNGSRSKLSPQDQRAIVRRLETGETVASLAKEFGVSRRTIDKCKPTANKAKPPTPRPLAWHVPVKTGRTR